MKWDQLVHTVSLSTTSAKCSKSMNHILVTLKWLNIFYYCVWHESMLWWVHCESPKITKNYLHVDIKCASLKYRIIQYKEPINYGKEHKESTKLQETKYILQIHLDAIFFFNIPFFIHLLYLPIEDVSDVAQLCNCIHKCFKIQWLNTENNPDTWWLASIDYRLLSTNNISAGIQSHSLQSSTMRRNTVWMNSECEEGKERDYYAIQKWEGYDCLTIQSTMAMDITWTVVGLFFLNVFTK